MTNEQQAIYAKYIRGLVSLAIQKAAVLMPKGSERPAHNKGLYVACLRLDCTPEAFPDHYTQGLTVIPELEPFDDVLAMLDNDIEMLTKGETK